MRGINEVSQFIVSLLRVVCESRFRVKEIVNSVPMVYLTKLKVSQDRTQPDCADTELLQVRELILDS